MPYTVLLGRRTGWNGTRATDASDGNSFEQPIDPEVTGMLQKNTTFADSHAMYCQKWLVPHHTNLWYERLIVSISDS
jgi:hypothetical protein